MINLATRCPRSVVRRVSFLVTLAVGSLAASEASAQFGGRAAAWSERWYGQNFYDHQHNGVFALRSCGRQYTAGYYGPPQMYSRQYGDEYGYATARPFRPQQPIIGTGTGGNPQVY